MRANKKRAEEVIIREINKTLTLLEEEGEERGNAGNGLEGILSFEEGYFGNGIDKMRKRERRIERDPLKEEEGKGNKKIKWRGVRYSWEDGI